MATPLDVSTFYDGADYLEADWRNLFRIGLLNGVRWGELNSFNTFGDSTGLHVKSDTGYCLLEGNFGQNSSQQTVPIVANASGNPRIDRVVLRNDFVANQIVLDTIQGTPAGSPTAPSLTRNSSMYEFSLAQVAVASGAVTITAGNVTDERAYTNRRQVFETLANTSSGVGLSTSGTSIESPTVHLPANWLEMDCEVRADFNFTIGSAAGTIRSYVQFEVPLSTPQGAKVYTSFDATGVSGRQHAASTGFCLAGLTTDTQVFLRGVVDIGSTNDISIGNRFLYAKKTRVR